MKYPQLHTLVKCVLSLSHGNAVPERGFSINKLFLESHGYSIENSTICALRIVKDMIHKVGGVKKFPVKKLIPYVKVSYAKYTAYLDAERARKQQRAALLALKAATQTATQEKKTVLVYFLIEGSFCYHFMLLFLLLCYSLLVCLVCMERKSTVPLGPGIPNVGNYNIKL